MKAQKEEIKKMKGNQQHLKKQCEHDIRKGEREMAKLKEKLVQVYGNVVVIKSTGNDALKRHSQPQCNAYICCPWLSQ